MECIIHRNHSLNVLYKSKHFPEKYNRKCEKVFYSVHTDKVKIQNLVNLSQDQLVIKAFRESTNAHQRYCRNKLQIHL